MMTTIAFIGLGNMGNPMAANLVKAGHAVQGFDLCRRTCRSRATTASRSMANAAAAVKDAEVVITMLPAGKHVLSVYEDIAPKAAKGTLFIDCSTIDVEFGAAGARHRRQATGCCRSTRRFRAAPAARPPAR